VVRTETRRVQPGVEFCVHNGRAVLAGFVGVLQLPDVHTIQQHEESLSILLENAADL